MLEGAEDWECWQRLLRHGYVFWSTPSILAVYRQKASSMVRSMPGQHLAEADRLLKSVHQEIDADSVLSGTPFVYDDSFGTYQHKLNMAERVLQFMGLAYLTEDDAQLDAAVSQLDPEFWPIAERNLNVSALLDVGIRRGYALDAEGFRHFEGKIAPIRNVLLERLSDQGSEVDDGLPIDPLVSGPDVLFVPENAAQADYMALLAANIDTSLQTAMLDLTMHGGSTGVRNMLDSRWEGMTHGLNDWALSAQTARVVVLQWPVSAISFDFARTAKLAGSRVVEVRPDPPVVAQLDESRPLDADHTIATVDELSDLLSEVDSEERTPSRWGGSPRAAGLVVAEEFPDLPVDSTDLVPFRNRHIGERCVIIGNGPSLNLLDLTRLRNENTIGVNGIFYAETLDFPLTYYVVEDTSVMEENLDSITSFAAGHKFFPALYREMYHNALAGGVVGEENVIYFTMNRGFYAKGSPNYCVPRFSTDASQRLYCGQSVTTINLQLAYYMGFSEVYLIGMDFSYTIPESAEIDEDLITSTEDDPNHFHKDYFGKGKTWKDPKLDRVMNNYQLAKAMFEADGRTIYNATAGGKLEIFPRADFHEVFAR